VPEQLSKQYNMSYYINLNKISLDEYKKILKSADLLPSRKMLLENVDHELDLIKKQGIKNLADLLSALKNKNKLQAFAEQSGVSEDYLTILNREIKGYHPRPNKLRDFPDLEKKMVEKLEEMGFTNTLKLYDKVVTPQQRKELAQFLGAPEREIFKLTKLTDLSRIKWVNHTFANVLYQAGFDTVEKVASADYKELYKKVKKLNEEQHLYKGHIGLNDMKRCVEAAKDVPWEIEY
jgi:hypothetical protein